MNARFLLPAALLLATPLIFAQQDPMPGPMPMQDHGMHHDDPPDFHHRHDMRGPEGDHGMWWNNPEVITRLAITPDQKKKMDEIFLQSRVQLIDLNASLEKEQLLLQPLMDANPVDQPKALAQIDKIADTRAELEKTNAKMLLGIRSVLTPEQWTKLRAGHSEWRDHKGGPEGPGYGRMGAPGYSHHKLQAPPTPPPAN
jgi:Spy/CpxP family protein refolding chaperone